VASRPACQRILEGVRAPSIEFCGAGTACFSWRGKHRSFFLIHRQETACVLPNLQAVTALRRFTPTVPGGPPLGSLCVDRSRPQMGADNSPRGQGGERSPRAGAPVASFQVDNALRGMVRPVPRVMRRVLTSNRQPASRASRVGVAAMGDAECLGPVEANVPSPAGGRNSGIARQGQADGFSRQLVDLYSPLQSTARGCKDPGRVPFTPT
jgi:hypothetical protein